MLNQWYFATGELIAPAGLILGLTAGEAVPTNWEGFTDADGMFICGTTDNLLVDTSEARSGIAYNVVTDGGHWTGTEVAVKDRGFIVGYGTTEPYHTPRKEVSDKFDHTHALTVDYAPERNNLNLIQAQRNTEIPLNAIMFGTEANADQEAYALLNDNTTGYLGAGNTEIVAEEIGTPTLGSGGAPHEHDYKLDSQRCQILSPAQCYASIAAGGAAHTHGGTVSLSITPALQQAVVRAFKIIDKKEVVGLIGMWLGATVPDKWELVAEFDGRYLKFNAAGMGATSGDNTVSTTGTTSSYGHSHALGALTTGDASAVAHTNTVTHTHSCASTEDYEPERYYMKFIKYIG